MPSARPRTAVPPRWWTARRDRRKLGVVQERPQVPTAHVAAAALLGLKALLGLWAAIVVLSASATRPHSFLGQAVRRRAAGVGFLLLVLVAVTVVVVVALLQRAAWAPVATYVLEGLAALLALTRIGSRPRAAILALILSAAIVALVYLGTSSGRARTT